MNHDTGVSTPIQRRPESPSLTEFRHGMETLMGVILHKQHTAERYSEAGDAHSREHWRAVAGAHRADAELVAKALGISETDARARPSFVAGVVLVETNGTVRDHGYWDGPA